MEDSTTKNKRVCSNCGSTTTYIRPKTGWAQWGRDKKGGWWCSKCYNKLVTNPKWHPITNKKWNPISAKRHLTWTPTGKIIYLKENPRKEICSWCGKKATTQIHHFAEYHEDDPLKDTIELCESCHGKETRRLNG